MPSGVYANRDDLIQTALEELKVVAYGQPAAASEKQAVDEHVDMVLAECAARDIVAIATTEQIPLEILPALAQVLARAVANKFSIPPEEVNNMFPSEGDTYSPENRLRSITRTRPTGSPMAPDYY